MPKFQMGVLGNQLCVNSNEGHERALLGSTRGSEFWYQQEAEASNRAQVLWKNTVVVDDATVLPAMLRVPRTIWWQNTFVVKDVADDAEDHGTGTRYLLAQWVCYSCRKGAEGYPRP